MINLIFLIFIALAGIFNSAMDKLQFHFHKSIFSYKPFSQDFWDPKTSWKNKYKERGNSFIVNLIEKLDNYGLVFLTDGWHLMQMSWRVSIFIAIILHAFIGPMEYTNILVYNILIDFGLMTLTYLGTFVLFFNKVFSKKT